MTRRRSLTPDKIKLIRSMHKPGKIGYETISKQTGIPVSTIRDCLLGYSQYTARVI